ncbi:MAG TPA: EAL domain-containing protein, partial [Gammaproteobacteria bacterium]|nr:EAL domain-containing protein [Gammaproteobacteria bacterium]
VSAIFFTINLFFKQKTKNNNKYIQFEQTIQQLEKQLQEQQIHLNTLFNNTEVGIILLQLNGQAMKANASFGELLGYSDNDATTINFYDLIDPIEAKNLQQNIQCLLDGRSPFYQTELQCFYKNGNPVWVKLTLSLVRDTTSKPVYYIAQMQNLTLQKRAEERLSHMAYHDALTGLANRNKLEQFITHVLATGRRHQQEFALLFLDLDRFKNINDTIGHTAGDLILQVIAGRLQSTVRNTDMVARLGGDEFVLLITDVKKAEAVALIAEKVLTNILKTIVVKGQEIYLTTSIGISLFPHDGQNMQTLMKNADLALYRAKEHGRNNYQFYSAEMTTHAQEKITLQNALGHALVKEEFSLCYQPKMELQSRRVVGVEAFLRWKNKEYGTITPYEIITLAEENGLIIPVSNWVMKTACQQLKQWHDLGFVSLSIAVNCSSRLFKHATFVDDVLAVITTSGLSPAALEIEVTETTIMEDPQNTLRVLYALKDIGVRIVIDDFGTGYWSLNNLKRLAIDKIKIDKTFIKQVNTDEISAAITRAIIAMANKLAIVSIAEGVETKEQYEFLIREGCMEIQGYYLTQPLSNNEMTHFLQHPIPDAEAISKGIVQTS